MSFRRHRLRGLHSGGGETSFDNLRPRCWPQHRDETERDKAAGLLTGDRGPPLTKGRPDELS